MKSKSSADIHQKIHYDRFREVLMPVMGLQMEYHVQFLNLVLKKNAFKLNFCRLKEYFLYKENAL